MRRDTPVGTTLGIPPYRDERTQMEKTISDFRPFSELTQPAPGSPARTGPGPVVPSIVRSLDDMATELRDQLRGDLARRSRREWGRI